MDNYFEILNISENAEAEVIHSAYKALARKYHPDNEPLPEKFAVEKMAAINEAYRVLSDDKLRAAYVRELHREEQTVAQADGSEKSAGPCFERKADIPRKKTKPGTGFDTDNILTYIAVVVVVVSLICCLIHFAPGLLQNAWENICAGVEKIVKTF